MKPHGARTLSRSRVDRFVPQEGRADAERRERSETLRYVNSHAAEVVAEIRQHFGSDPADSTAHIAGTFGSGVVVVERGDNKGAKLLAKAEVDYDEGGNPSSVFTIWGVVYPYDVAQTYNAQGTGLDMVPWTTIDGETVMVNTVSENTDSQTISNLSHDRNGHYEALRHIQSVSESLNYIRAAALDPILNPVPVQG